MVWSLTSGKRQITMDGQEVHYASSRAGIVDFDNSARREFHEKAAKEKKAYEHELGVWNQAQATTEASRYSPLPITSYMQSSNYFGFERSTSPGTAFVVSDDDGSSDVDNDNSHVLAKFVSTQQPSSFSIEDCDPLMVEGGWSFTELASHCDEECFKIISALRKG